MSKNKIRSVFIGKNKTIKIIKKFSQKITNKVRDRKETKMSYLYLEYPKCTTCKKAKKWLVDHAVEFEARDIKEMNPSVEELTNWYEIMKKNGVPLKKLFNTSGILYKEMQLKDRLPEMTEEEQIALLSTNGMLVKRPLVIMGDKVLIGFKETEWESQLVKK